MSLNIPNLDKLLAHLEAQPPESINMGFGEVLERPGCGSSGCIQGHSKIALGDFCLKASIGMPSLYVMDLTHPKCYWDEQEGVRRYPAHRVIATLKRLRDRFLATGEIVVDWGPEPTAGETWASPQATELTPPTLPDEITRLLDPAKVKV